MYSGDLNNEHLNDGNIWITNFNYSGIQMCGIQMVVQYLGHYLWYLNTHPVCWYSDIILNFCLLRRDLNIRKDCYQVADVIQMRTKPEYQIWSVSHPIEYRI